MSLSVGRARGRVGLALRITALVTALLVAGLGAAAQTAVDGAVGGTVFTAQGEAMAGARVVLRAEDGDRVRWVTAGRGGSFLALRLVPGTYVAELSVAGKVVARATVAVKLGEVSEVVLRDGVLKTGARDAPTGDLPVESQRWEDERTLVPEGSEVRVADSTEEDDRAPGADDGDRRAAVSLVSFRGVAPTQNATLLDGVSGDQGFRSGARGASPGGPRAQSTFSAGSVRMSRVSVHGYSAQYGGGAGAVVTTLSRGGGDKLHGVLGYVTRRSAWDATNPFSVETHYQDGVITTGFAKPVDDMESLSASLGGPLWRKLTGFASAEQQWRDYPAIASPSLAGFYALTPVQRGLLATRGLNAGAINTALNYLDSLTGEVPRRADLGLQVGRIDWRPDGLDNVMLSYARGRLSSPAGSGRGLSAAVVARGRASLGDDTVRTDSVTVRWMHLFGRRATNEVRGQFARDLEFETPRKSLAQEPGVGPGGYAPQVSLQGGEFAFGTPASLGRNAWPDEQRVQVADVLQWSVGRHLITAGLDWSRVEDRVDALANTEGSFVYDSGVTGGHAGGLVDWITDYTFSVGAVRTGGCPAIFAPTHFFCFRSFTQSFGQQQVDFVMHDFASFAQDRWRLAAGLTMEAGVRYEYTLLPLPQRPNAALDAAFGARGATSIFPEDRNNVGPRVAIAWVPSWKGKEGRWGTARLGYGVYYGRLPGSRVRAALLDTALPTTATRIRIRPTTETFCPQVAAEGFGYPCAFVSAPPTVVTATSSAAMFARNFRLPMVQQAELTLERGLGGWGRVSATYSMANAIQMPNTVDVNIAPSTVMGRYILLGGDGKPGVKDGETFVVPLYTQRVTAAYGPVTVMESNANATWHGLTVQAEARVGAGLAVRGAYTWSKAIDYGPEQGVTPRVNGQFDPFSIGYDKSLADGNFPQRFAGTVVWQSRWRSGSELMRRVLSGWRVSGIGTAGSGRPYSYQIFDGSNLSGGSNSINGSGGSTWLPTVGRNTLRLPERWNVNMRVGRGFRVGRVRGEEYIEGFNVANHVSAAQVNARAFLAGDAVNGVVPLVYQDAATVAAEGLNTPAFGTVTSSTTGLAHERQLQMGLRLTF